MEKMHEKIRNLKRFDPKRNDCAACKPGRVQCGPPMEKVYNLSDLSWISITKISQKVLMRLLFVGLTM